MPRLVAVIGSSPGVGKSTTGTAICRWLGESGLRVHHFEEQHILERAEFARAAEEFNRTGFVAPGVFLEASAAYLRTMGGGDWDVAVTDALFPFLPSLRAFGLDDDEIADFSRQLRVLLEPMDPVLVYLDGEPGWALARAMSREGPGWLEWFVDKVATYRQSAAVRDYPTAVAYLRQERDAILRMLDDSGWQVELVPVDEAATRNQVAAAVRSRLGSVWNATGPGQVPSNG
jgi:hypothetical protein